MFKRFKARKHPKLITVRIINPQGKTIKSYDLEVPRGEIEIRGYPLYQKERGER